MKAQRKGGRKVEPLRWSVERAASEFGVDYKTLASALRRSGQDPDRQGYFTTKQVCAAVFGDLEAERIRETRERADKYYLDNQVTKGQLITRDAVRKFLMRVFANVRQRILASHFIQDEQDEILLDLKAMQDCEWVNESDEPVNV